MRNTIKEGLRKWQPGIRLFGSVFSGTGPIVLGVVGAVSINFSKHLVHTQSDRPVSSIPRVPLHHEEISAEKESRFDEG